MYTYKDLKIAVLQKLDETQNTIGGTITTTDLITEYITAIPRLLNEALQYCATAGRFIVKSIDIVQDGTDTGIYKLYDLEEEATDFYSLLGKQVMFNDGETRSTAGNYNIEGDRFFVVDPAIIGTWTIYYNSYPQAIDADTIDDDTEIDVADEVYAMLALHIAGEILLVTGGDYAITRKSEFEQRLQKLSDTPIVSTKATVKVDESRRFF